jgi:hypothetical protein
MRRLADLTGIPAPRMLFIGDRLDEGGNDFPVIAVGVQTRAVDGWEDTSRVVEELVHDLRLAGSTRGPTGA